MISKVVSKLTIKVLDTNISDSKLVSKRLLVINLEYKLFVIKTFVANKFRNYFINLY